MRQASFAIRPSPYRRLSDTDANLMYTETHSNVDLCVCLFNAPDMSALYVCLTCLPSMSAFYVCLMCAGFQRAGQQDVGSLFFGPRGLETSGGRLASQLWFLCLNPYPFWHLYSYARLAQAYRPSLHRALVATVDGLLQWELPVKTPCADELKV